MKKTLCIILALALCLLGAAMAEDAIANPWIESTSADIAEAIGATFGIPEGAQDVAYSLLPEDGLAEMCFTLDGMEYVARIQPAEAFTDISGLYYEWEADCPLILGDIEGLDRRATDGEETVDSALWFDEMMGLMYSLFTSSTDLDGYDITAIAAAIYVQAEEAE